jgi:hypothetical protein
MRELAVGTMFSYRIHPRWRFWRRGWGGAQVIGAEDSRNLLHLRVFGTDGSVISHLPIEKDCVFPFIHEIFDVATTAAYVDDNCRHSILRWREESVNGTAGIFNIPIGAAIDTIESTLPSEVAMQPYQVESAYPIRAEDGEFRRVFVIVS